MLHGAIFDIDGTLMNSVDEHGMSWGQAFRERGHDVSDAAARAQIGKGGDKLLPVFLDKDTVEREGEALSKRQSEIFRERFRAHVRPFPKVRELFLALHERGVKIALASSSKAEDLEYYKQVMEVEDLLETATSSEDVENSKPDPDIFQSAFARLQPVEKTHTLAFGDSPYDAEAATKMGLRVVGVRCGGFPEDDLRKAGASAIYNDPAELLAKLDEIMALV